MKVNNIVLFLMLIMLSNENFAQNLKWASAFTYKKVDLLVPNTVYTIWDRNYLLATYKNKLLLSAANTNPTLTSSAYFKLSNKDREDVSWTFEINLEGSFSIRTVILSIT